MACADAIVVLGGGISDGGALSDDSRSRVAAGVSLFRDGVAGRIIASGGYGLMSTAVPARSEAHAMAEYAHELGVSPDRVLTESLSRDTVGNAHFVRGLFLEPNAWRRVRVVTSDYHLSRAAWVFAKVLGPAYDVSFSGVAAPLATSETAARLREEAAIAAFLRGWLAGVPDGDAEAMDEFIRTEHPGHAPRPALSLDEMRRIIDGLAA